MKPQTSKHGKYGNPDHGMSDKGAWYRFLFWLAIAIVGLCSCCRPATAHQVQKWEQCHKFESPGGFWGLHIFQKKNVYKY